MDRMETTLRRLFAAGVGAADIGAEKLGEFLKICEERGELTLAKGRALNEELKHTVKDAAENKQEVAGPAVRVPDVSSLTQEERKALLEKLLAMDSREA